MAGAAFAIGALIVAAAFAAAPHSCAGGLEFYAGLGVVATGALFALPFVLARSFSLSVRWLGGTALALVGIALWSAGLFGANVRIICRLF